MKRHRNTLRPETVAMLKKRADQPPAIGWVPDTRVDPRRSDRPKPTGCDGRGCDHPTCRERGRRMVRERLHIDLAAPALSTVLSRAWATDTAIRL